MTTTTITTTPLVAALVTLGLHGCSDRPLPVPCLTPADVAAARLEAVRGDPAALRDYLARMPKGADLHNHLLGSFTTESMIRWGSEDGGCVDTTDFTAYAKADCLPGMVPMSQAPPGSDLYAKVLGAWSMEGFQGDLLSRHDHFFDVFQKFENILAKARYPEGIAEVMSFAAAQRQRYLELEHDFDAGEAAAVASEKMDVNATWTEAYLIAKRAEIVADPRFVTAVETSRRDIESWTAAVHAMLGCGGAQAAPACDVEVRYLLSGCRVASREWVFGQFVFGFELAQVAPAMLGVNLVKPEENSSSLRYYDDEMNSLGVLRRLNEANPRRSPVHIALHAGELVPAVITAGNESHLTFHIRHAIELATAERIGHGVDVLGETAGAGVEDLLRQMAQKQVAVEICLGSNAVLLDVTGSAHPLASYRAHGVPVSLATDDWGVLRSDATAEFVRAVTEQHLDYHALKEMVRQGIDRSFLPGISLWRTPGVFTAVAAGCPDDERGADPPPPSCAGLLSSSERATQAWKLEGEFEAFERSFLDAGNDGVGCGQR